MIFINVLFQTSQQAEYKPVAHLNGHKLVGFENWWKNKTVICDKYRTKFTRSVILFGMLLTQMGAHTQMIQFLKNIMN